MRSHALTIGWFVAFVAFVAPLVHAQEPPTKVGATVTPSPSQVRAGREKAAKQKLESSDPEAIQQALEVLGELGGETAATAVGARLREGLPPLLIEQAIDALVQINRPSVGPVLLELTLHRRATVRQRAVLAIGALKIRSAQSALLYCLDDPNLDVRNAAVFALGTIGDQRAISALLSAADHGANEALESIGKIARNQNLPMILERARGADVALVRPALQVMMERTDYPLAGKLEIVKALAKLASPSARTLLVEWLEVWKTTGHPQLRTRLFDAIKQVDQATAAASTTTVTSTTTVAPAQVTP